MQRETGRGRQIRRVVVATSNSGKVSELQEALAPLGWQCEGLGSVTLPEETGSTYEETRATLASPLIWVPVALFIVISRLELFI